MLNRRALAALALAAATLLGGCAREQAPAVDYVLLNGQKASSQDWRGKVMLVNFWATSCATCVKEMPQVIATFDKFKGRGFDTLAVAMSYDPPAFVASAFGQVQMTPTTFLINKRGEIVKRFVGEPDFAALHGLIEQLLAEA